MLSREQIERYSRQIIMPEIGGKGQEKLLDGKVLIVGAGGLGSAVIQYLACAGVGKIGIMDGDLVEMHNLQRQPTHAGNIGMNKAESAGRFVKKLNPDVEAIIHACDLDVSNALDIIKDYDIIVDCTDSFQARYLINDACVLLNKPFVHAAVLRFRGELMTIVPERTACYRCLLPKAPPPNTIVTCQEAGVMGVTTGVLGVLQAAEVIKILIQQGELMVNKLLVVDLLRNKFEKISVEKKTTCPACGGESKLKKKGKLVGEDYEGRCELC